MKSNISIPDLFYIKLAIKREIREHKDCVLPCTRAGATTDESGKFGIYAVGIFKKHIITKSV